MFPVLLLICYQSVNQWAYEKKRIINSCMRLKHVISISIVTQLISEHLRNALAQLQNPVCE